LEDGKVVAVKVDLGERFRFMKKKRGGKSVKLTGWAPNVLWCRGVPLITM